LYPFKASYQVHKAQPLSRCFCTIVVQIATRLHTTTGRCHRCSRPLILASALLSTYKRLSLYSSAHLWSVSRGSRSLQAAHNKQGTLSRNCDRRRNIRVTASRASTVLAVDLRTTACSRAFQLPRARVPVTVGRALVGSLLRNAVDRVGRRPNLYARSLSSADLAPPRPCAHGHELYPGHA
jgi:hypothetical protein